MRTFLLNRLNTIHERARPFFDKGRGNDVDIADFPFLFTMQVHTGVSGMAFAAGWFGVMLLSPYRELYWNPFTIAAAALIELGFLAIILSSSSLITKIVYRNSDTRRSAADWDYFARAAMTILLLWFAVVCSALIWITGGMSSPFIPFYIMVYTLALTKCKLPHPGKSLLQFYALTFAVAGLAANKWTLPIAPAAIEIIKRGSEKEWAEFIFSLAAMAAPYWSVRYAEGREAIRNPNPPAPSSSSSQGPESLAPDTGRLSPQPTGE
jgi:hypothetical protein